MYAEGPQPLPPSFISLHMKTEVTYLIDEYGTCTWVCSVPSLLLSTIRLNLLTGNFYFLLDRPPQGKPLSFLFLLWWRWCINKTLVSQIQDHILQSDFSVCSIFCFVYTKAAVLFCLCLWCLCLSLNYFRIWTKDKCIHGCLKHLFYLVGEILGYHNDNFNNLLFSFVILTDL